MLLAAALGASTDARAEDDAIAHEALARCGPEQPELRAVAKWIAERKSHGLPMPDEEAIAYRQRIEGDAHPWARVWAAYRRGVDVDKLDAWLDSGDRRLRRCAVAIGYEQGTEAIAVVAIDALADLASVPLVARTGQWLTVNARLHVESRGATVLLLGPSGSPRTVPTSFDGGRVRARFALDRPGAFTVQVVADLARGGPRPVAEALVFADVDPALTSEVPAPGEQDATDASADVDALATMVDKARATSESTLPALARDARLDAIASLHAQRMARSHALAHDAGDGDPLDRLHAASLDARSVGENVAHARTIPLAHRMLWSSPSHRANILSRVYDRVGVAAARDESGEAWVVELFAGRLR